MWWCSRRSALRLWVQFELRSGLVGGIRLTILMTAQDLFQVLLQVMIWVRGTIAVCSSRRTVVGRDEKNGVVYVGSGVFAVMCLAEFRNRRSYHNHSQCPGNAIGNPTLDIGFVVGRRYLSSWSSGFDTILGAAVGSDVGKCWVPARLHPHSFHPTPDTDTDRH